VLSAANLACTAIGIALGPAAAAAYGIARASPRK